MKITIEKCVYFVHPIYDLYASDENGNIINIIKKIPHKGNKTNRGYLNVGVRKHSQPGLKGFKAHRFIWECFNGIILEGKVITQQNNCKKSAKDRDYTFSAKNHENRKCVKATNKDTNEVTYFKSMYATRQHLGINVGIVKMVCEGINHCKSGKSKIDGHYYTFEYIKDDELPINHKKSANIRPKRVTDEDRKKHQMEAMKKWLKKEWICPNCGKTYKNNYRSVHKNKFCNNQKQ